MKFNLLHIIGIAFILSSCDKKELIEKGVIGKFSIIAIVDDSTNLLYNLTLNIVEFNKDGTVLLPGIVSRNNALREDRNITGKWRLYQKKDVFFIDIISLNDYFKGTYEVSFDRNKEKEVLQIVLMNEKFILAGEKLFDHNYNKSFVDDLIKFTSKSNLPVKVP